MWIECIGLSLRRTNYDALTTGGRGETYRWEESGDMMDAPLLSGPQGMSHLPMSVTGTGGG